MSHRSRKFERLGSAVASVPARFFLNLSMRMPEPIIHAAAEICGRLFWLIGVPWRRLAMKNLRVVYKGTRTKKELRAIARQSMVNIVRMVVEMTVLFRPPYDAVRKMPIQGEEYLKNALEQGKPVLLLGSHVGNFLILIFALTLRGYPIHYIFKQPESGSFRDFIAKLNRDAGLSPIQLKPRGEALKRSLSTLRNKEVLWIALDQNVREGDVGVEFFGVKAATARGPAVLALRTGAVVLPVYARRDKWLRHTVIIREPIELEYTGDKEEDIDKNLRRFNAIIEREVLENPVEWWWVHERWKRARRYEQDLPPELRAD
jgi:Kdo2-lipid IVA lauroyltransferase/acyltransferase